MRVEIIAVGTELLLGDVVNTNAAWLSQELALMGLDVYYHATVGDNPERIRGIIRQAVERSDVLIFTGGLGPTEDDLTIATIADYFGAPLVLDEVSAETIRNYFIGRDQPMSKNNIKQALRPETALPIRNPIGTAPGILWDVSAQTGKETYILTFPGVPKELYVMWPQGADFLREKLRHRGAQSKLLVHEFLHFFGIGESKLGEVLNDLMRGGNPTVAPYVGNAHVKIRIVAKADTEPEGRAMIAPVKTEILARVGEYYFGSDQTTLEQRVGELLKEKGLTVAVAESCTGGLVSSRLTDVPGSSAYIGLNAVTYANQQKTRLLGVPAELFDSVGAVSPEVAATMAEGIRRLGNADIGISLTGVAGPTGGTEDKPVGLVYIGIAGTDGEVLTRRVQVNSRYSRTDIKHWFSQYALNSLRLYLEGRLPEQSGTASSLSASPSA